MATAAKTSVACFLLVQDAGVNFLPLSIRTCGGVDPDLNATGADSYDRSLMPSPMVTRRVAG